MSQCNFCSLQDIKKRNGQVHVTPSPQEGFPDGVIVRTSQTVHDPNQRYTVFVAWFAKLSDHCVCAED